MCTHNDILFALPRSSPSSFPSLPPSLCPSDNRPQKKDKTNVEKIVRDEYETQLASYRLHGGFWRRVSAAEAVTHTHTLSHTHTTPLERQLVHALPPEWIPDADSGQKEDRRDVRSSGVCGEKTEEEEEEEKKQGVVVEEEEDRSEHVSWGAPSSVEVLRQMGAGVQGDSRWDWTLLRKHTPTHLSCRSARGSAGAGGHREDGGGGLSRSCKLSHSTVGAWVSCGVESSRGRWEVDTIEGGGDGSGGVGRVVNADGFRIPDHFVWHTSLPLPPRTTATTHTHVRRATDLEYCESDPDVYLLLPPLQCGDDMERVKDGESKGDAMMHTENDQYHTDEVTMHTEDEEEEKEEGDEEKKGEQKEAPVVWNRLQIMSTRRLVALLNDLVSQDVVDEVDILQVVTHNSTAGKGSGGGVIEHAEATLKIVEDARGQKVSEVDMLLGDTNESNLEEGAGGSRGQEEATQKIVADARGGGASKADEEKDLALLRVEQNVMEFTKEEVTTKEEVGVQKEKVECDTRSVTRTRSNFCKIDHDEEKEEGVGMNEEQDTVKEGGVISATWAMYEAKSTLSGFVQ